MIFITVGSQKFQFNRLLKEVDRLAGEKKLTKEVFAQIGYSEYKPVNYEYKNFLDRREFNYFMEKSDIVITHGGTGAIINAVKKGKRVIAIPRLVEYSEHIDNHQLDIVRQFDEMKIICGIEDLNLLEKVIKNIENKEFESYKSNTESIIDSIDSFILNIN